MTTELKGINAYPEFRTQAGIDAVRTAVANNAPPAGTPRQQARFTAKFLNGHWVVANLPPAQAGVAGHGANRLFYRPTPAINLLLAYPDERQVFITRIYDDRTRGYGVGLQAFFSQIALTYTNIQKQYTDAFLKSHGNYQLQKTYHKRIISPIVAQTSNERWGIDLIDMSFGSPANRTNRFILTVVDYFSGYVWARAITNKTALTIRNQLQNIVDTAPPRGSGGTYPSILQSDNGAEFQNNILTTWATANHINHIYTKSYDPTSNGKVERANREIRKKIRTGNIRNNNFEWLQHLPAYIENINNQINARSKMNAVGLWRQGHAPAHPVAQVAPLNNNSTQQEKEMLQSQYLHNRSVKWQHGTMPSFNVGDNVRVNVASLSSDYRKAIKEHTTNKLKIHWSPVVSSIAQVYPPTPTRFQPRYSIRVGQADGLPPPQGTPVWTTANNIPILLSGNQLTLAGNVVSVNPKDIPQVDRLNARH